MVQTSIVTKLCFFQYEESKVTEAEMPHTALTQTITLGEEESGNIKIPFFCEVYKTLGFNSVSINDSHALHFYSGKGTYLVIKRGIKYA